jgi:hypothetical protein
MGKNCKMASRFGVRAYMSKRTGGLALGKTRMRTKVESRRDGVWVQLPKSVVHARAGLIPSEATDANPPPNGLTVVELLRWHRGQPVSRKAN